MAASNAEIAALFEELADLLDIDGANPFRIRAYRNAARTIAGYPRSMADLVATGQDLSTLPGIGRDLAGKVESIVATGHLALLDEVAARVPRVLRELMQIEGLGPRRVRTLHRELRIRSIADLRRAAEAGRIRALRGFGSKIETSILNGVDALEARRARLSLAAAEPIATALVAHLQRCAGVKDAIVAGSYRRRRETVGDLDVLVAAPRSAPVIAHFVTYEHVADILAQGSTRATARLRNGLQVDLRVVPRNAYGAALHYFTGSKAHNIALRRMGTQRGLKINEYGVFRGDDRIAGRSERGIFASVGLPYIPPELREDRGEIEAAASGKLPALITARNIRGDLHCHTTASDGRDDLLTMARAAAARGYEYVAISDHSRRVSVAHGLDERRLLAQIKEIDALNARLQDIVILKSIELEILADGRLDLPDRVLKELDFTVCAVHYQRGLPRQKQTERILRAMDNPYFTILAHPTGRLLALREPYAIDIERVMRAARERGCLLELNAHPARLDLRDEHCQLAHELGLKIAISTDAHSAGDLDLMRFGIDQARRGWLTRKDVINCAPLARLRSALRRA